MENIAFDIWLSSNGRMNFSDDDRRECFETAKIIVEIASDVRRNGLLSIDEKIPTYPDMFLRKYLQMAVDSTDPQIMRKIMQTHIVVNNYSGKRLLESIIMKDGIIAIVDGWNPWMIAEGLAVYFGDDLMEDYWDYLRHEVAGDIVKPVYVHRENKRPYTPGGTIAPHGYGGDKLSQEEVDALIIKLREEMPEEQGGD